MDLVQEHLDSMPESSGTSIGGDQPTSAETKDDFDPAKHATDKDGNPIFNKDGSYRTRRKRKTNTKSSIDTSKTQSSQQSCSMAATATIDGLAALTSLFLSTEWGYIKKEEYDERQNGIDVFTRYYEAKGVTDIPPGVGVAIWAIGYVGARLVKGPQTRSKLAAGWSWLKFKLRRKKGGSHADTRYDRERQDDAS